MSTSRKARRVGNARNLACGSGDPPATIINVRPLLNEDTVLGRCAQRLKTESPIGFARQQGNRASFNDEGEAIVLIYDCEIIKGIIKKGEERLPDIEYCDGWRDFSNMGISVIGAYDYSEDRYRVFCDDNFGEFEALVGRHDVIIGFNSLSFDNRLCEAYGIVVPDEKSYDLLVKVWAGAGLGPKFEYPSHAGYSLDAISEKNLGEKKSGHGALAPVQWQRGQTGSVIDYCLQDVRLTKRLVDEVILTGALISPVTGLPLAIRGPGEDGDK